MNLTAWGDLKRHLSLMLDDEVRIFSEADLVSFEDCLSDPDPNRAARQVAAKLEAGHLSGSLLNDVAQRFEAVLGVPVTLGQHGREKPADLNRWATVSEATTMERPLSVEVIDD